MSLDSLLTRNNAYLLMPNFFSITVFLHTGAESLGYSGMAHGMFSAGGVDLVNHFYQQCNNKLEDLLSAKAKEIMDNPEL